jgi:hypothetical protein
MNIRNIRVAFASCVAGALISGFVASSAAALLFNGLFSKDLSKLKLEPLVKEEQIKTLREYPAGKLIVEMNENTQNYSKQMVEVTTKLSNLLHEQLVSAFVGGGLCFLLFSYVAYTLWRLKAVDKT